MLPIAVSPLAPFFDDPPTENHSETAFLENGERTRVWNAWADDRAEGLYDLPNENWLLRVHWRPIYRWIDAYNGKTDAAELVQAIAEPGGWDPDTDLFLIQNSQNIVFVTPKGFSQYWDSLLAAFDDGPLLVSERSPGGPVFRFAPLGSVLLAMRSER